MTTSNKTVKIFMMPQEFPCGPQSSCCGPVGQSEEEIGVLKSAMEKETGSQVEVVNTTDENYRGNHLQIAQLMGSFGQGALPIITLDGEVVSMGNPEPEQAVSAIREKINQM